LAQSGRAEQRPVSVRAGKRDLPLTRPHRQLIWLPPQERSSCRRKRPRLSRRLSNQSSSQLRPARGGQTVRG